ncbi:methyl-accepting chemotaxis protein [Sporomusa aerivorans]|uniref:methyl-accepting chemotaxis protein n=1 Tax=Sporomusa aerivorans TaxID=204936 RepID=UPI00352BC84E
MRILSDFKTAAKIYSLIIFMVLCLIGVGWVGLYSVRALSREMTIMYQDRLIPIQLLGEVRLLSKDSESKLVELILTDDRDKQQIIIKNIQDNTTRINQLQAEYAKSSLDAYQTDKLANLEKELTGYRKVRQDIITLATSGRQQEAFDLYSGSASIFNGSTQLRRELIDYNKNLALQSNLQEINAATQVEGAVWGVTAAAVLLACIFGRLLVKMIAKPLTMLTAGVRQVADGNLTQLVPVSAKDEFGRMGSEFNSMTEKLCHIIREVIESAEHVSTASKQLTASAGQSAQAANQVATSVSDISQASQEQLSALTGSLKAVEKISSAIQQIAANAAAVATDADRTTAAAQTGCKEIGAVVAQMDCIEQTVKESSQVVTGLGTRSEEIGQIVSVITNIASQTNLLALNAAIEAARAGEQGRGFAVVADEVRKLAEQSQAATQQISGLINEIRQETERAVVAMHKGSREVELGSQQVHGSGKIFQDIVSFIDLVSKQTKGISGGIQDISLHSSQIVTAIRHVSETGKDILGQTQTVSAATEEQSAAMEEIASSSQALARLAEGLRKSTGRFKV